MYFGGTRQVASLLYVPLGVYFNPYTVAYTGQFAAAHQQHISRYVADMATMVRVCIEERAGNTARGPVVKAAPVQASHLPVEEAEGFRPRLYVSLFMGHLLKPFEDIQNEHWEHPSAPSVPRLCTTVRPKSHASQLC